MTVLDPIAVDALPRSVGDFIALRDRIARDPQGGAAATIVALLAYAGDEELGQQCLAAAVDRELSRSDVQRVRMQIDRQPYMLRSYVKGATPENGYRLPTPPYVFEFSANPHSGDPASGTYKVFAACAGAASPRPVTVQRDDQGIWKAREWSSLVVGVQAPARETDDV